MMDLEDEILPPAFIRIKDAAIRLANIHGLRLEKALLVIKYTMQSPFDNELYYFPERKIYKPIEVNHDLKGSYNNINWKGDNFDIDLDWCTETRVEPFLDDGKWAVHAHRTTGILMTQFPNRGVKLTDLDASEPMQRSAKSKGGAPEKYPWSRCLPIAFLWVARQKTKPTNSDVVRILETLMADERIKKNSDTPESSQFKFHAKNILDDYKIAAVFLDGDALPPSQSRKGQ